MRLIGSCPTGCWSTSERSLWCHRCSSNREIRPLRRPPTGATKCQPGHRCWRPWRSGDRGSRRTWRSGDTTKGLTGTSQRPCTRTLTTCRNAEWKLAGHRRCGWTAAVCLSKSENILQYRLQTLLQHGKNKRKWFKLQRISNGVIRW